MKQLFFTVFSFMLINSILSQSIEDVRKDIYNERNNAAEKKLLTMLNSDAANPDAVYWLAEIYLQQGKIDTAYQLYRNKAGSFLQKEFKKNESPLVYIGWAHVLLDSGKTAEAKAQMDNILKETKYKNATALWAVAKANIDSRNGDMRRAIELLNMAVKKDKKNPELYNTLGDAYRKLTDGSNAVRNYNIALEIDPKNTEATYKSGKIYKTQNNAEIYLEKFKQAYSFDSTYTPVLYELYQYYFSTDVYYANIYLNKYLENADPDPKHAYMKADLFYLSKNYGEAIKESQNILSGDRDSVQPRLYKLIAYSYAGLGDSAAALSNINSYFEKQDSVDYVSKDFALKAQLMDKLSKDTAKIIALYKDALRLEKDEESKLEYLTSLADLSGLSGNIAEEAIWREQLFDIKKNPSNLDLYKWGLALYQNNEFEKADSVFAIYQEKYPGQVYGALYRARSNASIDSSMEKGLAVPHYKSLIDVAEQDEEKNKTLLLMAYEYLGAYEANITKQYSASLGYFDKVLELDPGNEDAERNTTVIKKWMQAEEENH